MQASSEPSTWAQEQHTNHYWAPVLQHLASRGSGNIDKETDQLNPGAMFYDRWQGYVWQCGS